MSGKLLVQVGRNSPPTGPPPPPPPPGSGLIVGLNINQFQAGSFGTAGQALTEELSPDSVRVAFNHGDATFGVNWAAARGIGVIYMLGYSVGCDPTTAAGRQCYADRSAAIAVQHGSKVQFYEIWNEWNGGFGLGVDFGQPPASDAAMYTDLLRRTYIAVKAVRPQAIICGGVTAGVDTGFIGRMYDNGAQNFMDMISVHLYVHSPRQFSVPYNSTSTVAVDKYIDTMNIIRNLGISRTGMDIPIVVSESGRNDQVEGAANIPLNETRTADFIRVLYTRVRAETPFVKGIWWYALKDFTASQNGFGLARVNDTRKPGFFEFQARAAA